MKPLYLEAYKQGVLRNKISLANQLLKKCNICPRSCGVNRLKDEKGICNTGFHARISSYAPHFGEESPLVGKKGSGTIFFTHCNLLCNFCQNFEISHLGRGMEITDYRLAEIMIELQDLGCHNINFVTPSHVVPQILSALEIAIEMGLYIPLVYNSGGYDDVTTLQLLEGCIDIYMPDFKFWDNKIAYMTCLVKDYREIACKAIKEMHRQVGDLYINSLGIAEKGLLIRHLVMPNGTAGTREIMQFIHDEISFSTYVNIMSQYHPCGIAQHTKNINRRISADEFIEALNMAKSIGITRLDKDIVS